MHTWTITSIKNDSFFPPLELRRATLVIAKALVRRVSGPCLQRSKAYKKSTEDNVTRPKLCYTTDCRWICLPSPPWHFALVLFSSMCLTDELNKKTLKTHKKERESVLTVLTVTLVIIICFVDFMCSRVALNQLWSLTVVVFLFLKILNLTN